jgi:outer membrane protein TolC
VLKNALMLCLAVLTLLLAACETALERVDREAFEEIRRQQEQALRQMADPDAVPARPPDSLPTDRSYERQPATTNPTSAELPAQRAAPDADPLKTMPDAMAPAADDPNATRFNLPASLAYAVKHSREYRNQQEELYLTTLDLLVQQHLWGPRFFQTVSARAIGGIDAADHDDAVRIVHEAGVRQRLPYGGEVAARALVQYVDLLRAVGETEGHSEALALSVTLPLLRGAGKVAQEDLIQAQRDLVYAAREFERYRREFLLDVATRYYDLLRQQAEIENLKGQVSNYQWLLRRIQALADAGREPYFEVQRSEQQVLFAQNNLLNRQEQYAQALDNFKIVLGMEMRQPVVIEPSEVVIAEPALEMEKAVATALSNRLDLQTAQDRIEDSRRRVAVAKNQTLPGLDVSAGVAAATVPDQSVNLDENGVAYNAGVTFDAPWDREVETIRWRKAMVNLERAQRTYTLERDQVIRQVRQSIRRIIQARSSLTLQNRNIDIARTRLRGVLLRLRSLGPRDFIEAQEDLTEARNRRDLAVRDLRVSILQYLLDTGQLRVKPDGQWEPPAGLVVPDGNDPLATPAEMLNVDPNAVPQMDENVDVGGSSSGGASGGSSGGGSSGGSSGSSGGSRGGSSGGSSGGGRSIGGGGRSR